MDDVERIIELAYAFGWDPDPVITAAVERDVPLNEVVDAYFRTLRYIRVHGIVGTSMAPITDVDAQPPGTFDPRIVLQDEWWYDILRRPFRVVELPRRYAANVITHLHNRVHSIVEVTGGGGNPHDWLEETPLVRALRRRVGDE